MLLGFGSAIAAGFLLTASQNWSGIRGVHGARLQILVALWFAGRLALLLPWPWLAAGLDLLFLPVLLFSLWPYLGSVQQKRNRIFLVLFGLQILGNGLYHLEAVGSGLHFARNGIYLIMHVFLLMIVVIGGRVIPGFTRNAIPGAKVSSWPWLEKASLGLAALWLITELIWPVSAAGRALALVTGLVHLLRLIGWRPWQAWHNPLLLILPTGYAWMVIGFLLRGLPAAWAPALPTATHAFTAGAMGVMMHGMVTRVSLGHTGRPLKASKAMIAGYIALNLGAIVRVGIPWLLPSHYQHGLLCAGLLWVLAFGLYVWECAPILIAPRPDGREG
jgi:uncharacterized protein involved in response to NO